MATVVIFLRARFFMTQGVLSKGVRRSVIHGPARRVGKRSHELETLVHDVNQGKRRVAVGTGGGEVADGAATRGDDAAQRGRGKSDACSLGNKGGDRLAQS